MSIAIFIVAVGAIYLMTRLFLAILIRELRVRLRDNYRFIGSLVAPVHWVLLLASVLIGMSLIGLETGRFVWLFYLAIAWFVCRVVAVVVLEWWLGTIRRIRLPGVARRLISFVVGSAGFLVFVRLRLDVRSDEIAVIVVVAALIVAVFFHGFVRDLYLGISMALEQHIRVGDSVSIGGHEGQVVAVDWKTTTLQNDRRERIVLSNRFVADAVVTHVAPETRRHGRIAISVPADTPPSAVLAELTAMMSDAGEVLAEPPPRVHYCGERAGEGRFEALFWAKDTADCSAVESDLRVAMWYRLRRRGLIVARTAFDLAPDEVCHALRRLPFLASATAPQLERLARGVRTARYGKGEALFRQHDRGDEIFLIQSGMLDVSVVNGRRTENKIASVGAGSFVGERSVLTGEPRSATVRATEDSIVFVVDKAAMSELLREDPELADEIAQIMAARDAERDQVTRGTTSDHLHETAHTLLERIRACFALD
jgi:CRP-like cAMP-binding protein/small-conductance mechanosensitive channel